ncbi:MAG: hypothetical protein AB4206_10080 [Xenococcaceae cyanobacterium]
MNTLRIYDIDGTRFVHHGKIFSKITSSFAYGFLLIYALLNRVTMVTRAIAIILLNCLIPTKII